MSIGMIVLLIVGLLLLFGVGQRVLDRMRLTDKQAIALIIAMIVGGFVPNIPLGGNVYVNLGGAVIPIAIGLYLWFTAGTAKERVRSLIATAITGVAVYFLMHWLPDEPEAMWIDPNYAYGIAAGIIAYIFGRSRRGAFIAGVIGMASANIAQSIVNRMNGIDQRLVLGGAGALDAIVFSGLIAVLLAELIGEIVERATRGNRPPEMAFENGHFERKEPKHHEH